jgi:hypothetical protein
METHVIRRVLPTAVLCALWGCLLSPHASAWKPTTHVYTANLIMDDAKDGKVTIPPYGEFEIAETARQALSQPDHYRAGSIGPDGFPDLWTGQSYIHTNTRPWALHLWDRASEYDDAAVWAFTYGFYLHLAGDVWAHDWVNAHARGAWPGAEDFLKSRDASLLNIKRHMAIENTFDIERDRTEKLQTRTIAIPRDFVLKEMVLCPELRSEMNPMVQALTALYDEKRKDKGDRVLGIKTYNALWFDDLDDGLRRYVVANERTWKQVVERDKDPIKAFDDKLGLWADSNLMSMLGAPDIAIGVANAVGAVFGALGDGITGLLRLAGLDIDVLKALRDKFVNAMLEKTMGVSKKDLEEAFEAEVGDKLFPTERAAIMGQIGTIPAQAMWPHGPAAAETDAAKADAYTTTVDINGPLYNSVILGKITLLSAEEFKRLAWAERGTRESGAAESLPANVMLENWLEAIDFSRQCQWKQGEREGAERQFMGYSSPHESPVFRRIFKAYPPVFEPNPGGA